ncbi:MAG: TetR/AcrR family transcriptional regulator [Janthinobacterium lividum]
MPDAVPTKEELIREQILAAGRQLLQQFGLRKTTMENIARVAGKGKISLHKRLTPCSSSF